MSELKFKTNINCNNCLSKVQPILDGEANIKTWSVDLDSDDRILTVDTDSLTPEQVTKTVLRAGYLAEVKD